MLEKPRFDSSKYGLRPAELSERELEVLKYIQNKCKSSRVPKQISITAIMNVSIYSYKQVRNVIDKLVQKGIIEKWTSTYGTAPGRFRKASYYRIRAIE